MKKFWAEFSNFAIKGNMIELAIGVIIGGAFNAVCTSLVKDIITPVLSIIIGRINISGLAFTISNIPGGGSITLSYGIFLQNLLNFFLTALFIFLMIRSINHLREKLLNETADEAAEKERQEKEALTKTEKLLTDIRDMMKEKES